MSEPTLPRHWRKMYDNKYLGAWNLFDDKTGKYFEANVTIESVRIEEVVGDKGRKENCTLLRFAGKRTPMILSRRQGKNVARMYGEDPNQWPGKQVRLWAEERKVKGEMCRVLAIKSPSGRGADMRALLEDSAPSPPPVEPEAFEADASAGGDREPGED